MTSASPRARKVRRWQARRIGPITRVSLGLTALLLSLLLVADLVLGVVPGRDQAERQLRKRMAENLTVQMTQLLQTGDLTAVGKTIQAVLARNPELRAISVQRSDGGVLLQRGELPTAAERLGPMASDLNHLRVPIMAGAQVWGSVELYFVPIERSGLRQWFSQPGVQLMLVLGFGGFLLSHAYLSRAMQYLNPSASVPDRVRRAYDNLTEGLLILDQEARIVLANAAFRRLQPAGSGSLNGQTIAHLHWLTQSWSAEAAAGEVEPPWQRTLAHAEKVEDVPLRLTHPDGSDLHLLVSSAPVLDDRERVRGCMVSFNDETALHRSHSELAQALADVEQANVEIAAKNEELLRLATRDPMTGCFNRRAFFEAAEAAFEAARREHRSLCCIMSDIDHFKSFNDSYGHAVGDQVIQVVARALTGGIRQVDVLCRYGGEEFCILLPGAQPAEAADIGERLRAEIEQNAQGAIRGTEVRRITSSFGVASLYTGAKTLQELIDQADQALYRSKESGRNRVTLFEREAARAD
jgi:diguanylate cyclase (GGDEF)-like protein